MFIDRKDPTCDTMYMQKNNILISHTGTMDEHRKFVAKHQLPKYKAAVEKFITEKGYEPTAMDYDDTNYLPSSRTIQRKFGGLSKFRELAGLKTLDFTKGKERSNKATKSMNDCLEDETTLFIDLLKKYGEEKVSSPARIYAFKGHTADFRIIKGHTSYLVDVFKPNSVQSFKGCINIKNRKYLKEQQSFYTEPVKFLYVCVNEEVMVPLKSEIEIISLKEFRKRFLS